jgi:anti-sigma regulatory factor (Ser/Thr protein kinase)
VLLTWRRSKALLRVRDFGPGFYYDFGLPDAMSNRGRGLFIVNQLAEHVDVSCDPTGCEVSAVLPVTHHCFAH